MKKMFVVSMLSSFAVICSCQKQDSVAEAQLAQRKTELDVREEALVQREKAADEKEKAVAEREKTVGEREKALANSRIMPPRTQAPDAAEAEAERQRRIQQLPPELRALIPDRSRMEAERADKDRITQDRAIQRQRTSEDARKKNMSAIATPQAAAPEAEATSPSPSPTPE